MNEGPPTCGSGSVAFAAVVIVVVVVFAVAVFAVVVELILRLIHSRELL